MPDGPTTKESTYHRKITDAPSSPDVRLVETIAELEDVDTVELPELYSCVGELVEDLFRSPPEADAQAELTFSYAGYRITVHQDGHVVCHRMNGTEAEG